MQSQTAPKINSSFNAHPSLVEVMNKINQEEKNIDQMFHKFMQTMNFLGDNIDQVLITGSHAHLVIGYIQSRYSNQKRKTHIQYYPMLSESRRKSNPVIDIDEKLYTWLTGH